MATSSFGREYALETELQTSYVIENQIKYKVRNLEFLDNLPSTMIANGGTTVSAWAEMLLLSRDVPDIQACKTSLNLLTATLYPNFPQLLYYMSRSIGGLGIAGAPAQHWALHLLDWQ
ncbi:hypothetical protein CR513_51173, partial [Mucuna pruriens]